MAISYLPLWKLLLDKKLKRTDLKDIADLSSSTLAKMGKDEYVSTKILERICSTLACNVEDVIQFVPDKDKNGEVK